MTSSNTVTEKGFGEGGIYFLEMHSLLHNPVNKESTLDYPDVCTTHKESLKVNQNLTGVLQFVSIVFFFFFPNPFFFIYLISSSKKKNSSYIR